MPRRVDGKSTVGFLYSGREALSSRGLCLAWRRLGIGEGAFPGDREMNSIVRLDRPSGKAHRPSGKAHGAIHDNVELDRFELDFDEGTAVAYYRLTPDAVVFVHTFTPEPLRGKGAASQLVRGALDWAKARGLKVVPECSFVAAFIVRHPEYADLASGPRASA
jgi:predicted GNAT family acetyltransferase